MQKPRSIHRIIQHNDSDGFASGAVVHKYLRGMVNDKGSELTDDSEIKFHTISYGEELPEIGENDFVYMVDFSIQPAVKMHDFAKELGTRFVWVDHHQTSIDMEKEIPSLCYVKGMREVKLLDGPLISGCELAWKYFFPYKKTPYVLEVVGNWDTWRHKDMSPEFGKEAKAFQYFAKVFELNPETPRARGWWGRALDDSGDETGWDKADVEQSLADGCVLMEYQRVEWKHLMESKGFNGKFMGLNAIIVNQSGNSEMFNGFFNPEEHDVMVTYQQVKGELWTVSLYTPKTDLLNLGRLAKSLAGGGGHAGAAGFQCGMEVIEEVMEVSSKPLVYSLPE